MDSDEEEMRAIAARPLLPALDIIDLRGVRPDSTKPRYPLDFVESTRAWREHVRRYGEPQSNMYTYAGGRRCALPIYACRCLVCMQRRVDDPSLR